MLETKRNRAVLIAAVSGRALAQAARRAGYRPLVADFFCDTDTVMAAERTAFLPGDLRKGVDETQTPAALRDLAAGEDVEALVLGSGFENRTGLVDRLSGHFPLTGGSADAIRRVKDPEMLARDCSELGIPHPAFRWDAPLDRENWVSRAAGGAGGAHVLPAVLDVRAADRYFQRRVEGKSIAALFVADGRQASIVGFSRQWASPSPIAPFRYGGAVRLKRFDRRDAARIRDWLSALTARTGLRGICSADFMRGKDGFQLLEINPRPGATLDIFDSFEAPLLQAHIDASRGKPFTLPRFADCMASMIAYAPRPVPAFPAFNWPDWTADHQSAGSRLAEGDPICTVFGRGNNADAACRNLNRNIKQLEYNWGGTRT